MRLMPPLLAVALTACSAPPPPAVADAEPSRQMQAHSHAGTRLVVVGEEPPLEAAVVRALGQAGVIAATDAATRLRLRRLPPGDAFEVVLAVRGEAVRDAIRRLDCPPPAVPDCAAPHLARIALDLLEQ